MTTHRRFSIRYRICRSPHVEAAMGDLADLPCRILSLLERTPKDAARKALIIGLIAVLLALSMLLEPMASMTGASTLYLGLISALMILCTYALLGL
jgi:hypothetical protein